MAHLAVKLCDVAPDGTSALVTRGLLNLTHRRCWPADGAGVADRSPAPVVPGQWMDVTVGLDATTWTLEPGHRLRLVVAGSDWPNSWPPPAPVRLGVDWSQTALALPVWAPSPAPAPVFGPGHGPGRDDEDVVWRIEHDVLRRETRAVVRAGGRADGDFGAVVDVDHSGTVGVSTVDPGRAWARGHATYRIHWPEASVTTEAVLEVRSDAAAYDVSIELAVARDGVPFAHRRWTERIPRRLQ